MRKILSMALALTMLKLSAQNITGSGTTNYIPKFTNTTVVGNSNIYQNGNVVGIGTTAPAATSLEVLDNDASTTSVFTATSNASLGAPGAKKLIQLRANIFGSGIINRFNVDRLGKTGINVSSPAAQLDIQAYTTGFDLLQVRNSSGNSWLSVTSNGNVGIGIAAPTVPFDIRNSSNAILLQVSGAGNLAVGNISPTYRLDVNCQQGGAAQPPFRLVNYLGNTNMLVNNNDRVGINVTNPDTYGGSLVVGTQGTGANALDLVSTATTGWCNQLRFYNASGARHLITDDRTNNYLLIKTGNGGGANPKLRVEGNQDLTGNLVVSGTGTVTGATALNNTLTVAGVTTLNNNLSVTGNSDFTGRVKIGNVTVPNSNYMLFVEKGILAERFKCALKSDQTNWSDYVFEKDYKLMKLQELEAFVKKYKHLPNIPSAEQVYKEGIDLANMDALLLEKIEELTLYVIELEKRIELLKRK